MGNDTSSIRGSNPANNLYSNPAPSSAKTDKPEASFEQVQAQANADLETVYASLGKISQPAILSSKQRYDAFHGIVASILNHPKHPCYAIEDAHRQKMIDSITAQLSDAPNIPIPRNRRQG